jgi:hypothetical protein
MVPGGQPSFRPVYDAGCAGGVPSTGRSRSWPRLTPPPRSACRHFPAFAFRASSVRAKEKRHCLTP